MNNEEKILKEMQKNNGMITTNEVEQMGIARKTLTRLLEKWLIERESQGLYVLPNSWYVLPNSWGDEYYNLIFSSKNVVFSHATALFLHGLSERVPLIYEITVIKGYNASLKSRENVELYFVNKDIFELGKIEIESPQGKIVPIYDIERTLCDMLKSKQNQDIEIIKYAFKTYVKSSKKDIYKLIEYAKKLKIDEEVNTYLEVLLWWMLKV